MRISTAALACALAAPLGAQMVWNPVSSTGPAPRVAHAIVHDLARGRVVLFGGALPSLPRDLLVRDTWEWDGRVWIERLSAARPSARRGHAMAYDAARQRVVMAGGWDDNSVLRDTWEWDGGGWTRVATTGTPCCGPMVYDSARRRVVLVVAPETWEWNGRSWTLRSPATSPTARSDHAITYDVARQRVVLFAGRDPNNIWVPHADTWEWDGTTWTRVASSGPRGRYLHAMTYDAERRRTILHGGRVSTAPHVLGDTWEWDGRSWTRRFPATSPLLQDHAMAYETDARRAILFGYSATTWEYRPTTRGRTASIGLGCPGSAGTPTLGALGPAIVGNRDFALGVGSVPGRASVFVGLSVRLASTSIPPCTVYPEVPFLDVLTGTATGGTAVIPLPIPWIASLSGADLFVQGGALDPGGALLGLASLTPGMQIRIGD